MFSIHGRATRSDLIKMWKAFNTQVDFGLLGLVERNFHVATRGHNCKVSIPICRTELRRRFWSVRCANLWNSLPQNIVEASSIEVFKNRLDNYMGSRFLKTVDGS